MPRAGDPSNSSPFARHAVLFVFLPGAARKKGLLLSMGIRITMEADGSLSSRFRSAGRWHDSLGESGKELTQRDQIGGHVDFHLLVMNNMFVSPAICFNLSGTSRPYSKQHAILRDGGCLDRFLAWLFHCF